MLRLRPSSTAGPSSFSHEGNDGNPYHPDSASDKASNLSTRESRTRQPISSYPGTSEPPTYAQAVGHLPTVVLSYEARKELQSTLAEWKMATRELADTESRIDSNPTSTVQLVTYFGDRDKNTQALKTATGKLKRALQGVVGQQGEWISV